MNPLPQKKDLMTQEKKLFENVTGKGENASNHYFLLLSSPEQEVLRVSYCDWSVVRLSVRPSVGPC